MREEVWCLRVEEDCKKEEDNDHRFIESRCVAPVRRKVKQPRCIVWVLLLLFSVGLR